MNLHCEHCPADGGSCCVCEARLRDPFATPLEGTPVAIAVAVNPLATELGETAAWLDERAQVLRQIAEWIKVGRKTSAREALEMEAVKMAGRASLLRVLLAQEGS